MLIDVFFYLRSSDDFFGYSAYSLKSNNLDERLFALPNYDNILTVYGNQTKYVATPDINECATEEQSCSADAVCNNTEGSYDCECKPGFSGDGWTCKGKAMKYFGLNSVPDRFLDCA